MKVIGTTELSFSIEKMILEARDLFVIVSPYLKTTTRLKAILRECFARSEYCLVVYRRHEVKEHEIQWLTQFDNVIQVGVENLHAKCYLNEYSGIITSMNLYEYSQINNHELGVCISASEGSAFVDLLAEVRRIVVTQVPDFDFTYLDDRFLARTMGNLFDELCQKFDFPAGGELPDGKYLYICQAARALHSFSADELYRDRTAVLRSTKLKGAVYQRLYKKLGELGRKK
ncbi:MAG: phospholipase D family protein [Calditrichaeota bacterium]|nr:phospholipase D family protein [Calditrichota bacterium]